LDKKKKNLGILLIITYPLLLALYLTGGFYLISPILELDHSTPSPQYSREYTDCIQKTARATVKLYTYEEIKDSNLARKNGKLPFKQQLRKDLKKCNPNIKTKIHILEQTYPEKVLQHKPL